MAESGNIHWTDDDELLSKFVLHQLPASEEYTLSAHLITCEKCRHAVNMETRIVAGTKLMGRAALKERLKVRLSEREEHGAVAVRKPSGYQIPWTQIVSLAAVVAIIIALGVYNNWFSSNYRDESTPQEQAAGKHEPPTPESAKKEIGESTIEKLQGKDLAQSDGSAKLDHFDNRRVKRTEIQKGKGSEEKPVALEVAPSVTVEPGGNAGTGVAADMGREAENELQINDEAVAPAPQTFWVEGHVIPDALEKSRGMLSATPRDQVAIIRKHEAKAKEDDHEISKAATGSAMPTISINQKPSASLPASLQYRENRQGIIQTLLEDKNNAIEMTLYLDSPIADSELHSANIEVINNDSLVLNLPNQRIGLRLPPALQSRVNTKLNR